MLYGFLLLLATLPAPAVTFNRDIAPLVYEHCAPCHHTGGIGPFPLMDYASVANHASQIVKVTASRYMPPWPPTHGYGHFRGDRSLSAEQIALFSEWVRQNKPEGSPGGPAAPHFGSEWQLGPPDLILTMDQDYLLPAGGADVFRNFILPSGVNRTRYVRGFEIRMVNPRPVHHANVVLDRTRSLRRRNGSDGQPGFAGMDVTTEAAANNFDPDSHFLFFKPGSVLRAEPPDMAWRLDPDTDLVLNMHLQPSGKPERVRAEVGLYFTDRAPSRFPILVQLEHDGAIHIPAGSRSFAVTDSLVLPEDVEVLAIYPHAHYLGKQMDAWAKLPNGARVPLIRIADWDINWQAVYEYAKPVMLPKGSRVEMRITYDNSTLNPRNPHHPPQPVETGNRSEDEMGHVWLQLLPKAKAAEEQDPRLPIQEAVMKRRLEKYPDDFLAHYNLAALLQLEDKLDEAIAQYGAALKEQPDSATAHNSLGAALLLRGDEQEARRELQKAIELDSGYVSAHYNLARLLGAEGELAQAASEYELVLKAQPDDGGANAGLGAIEYKLHHYPEALLRLSAACKTNPDDADLQANLGTVLAITGNLEAAQQALEKALRLDPQQAAAKANLDIVRANLAKQRP